MSKYSTESDESLGLFTSNTIASLPVPVSLPAAKSPAHSSIAYGNSSVGTSPRLVDVKGIATSGVRSHLILQLTSCSATWFDALESGAGTITGGVSGPSLTKTLVLSNLERGERARRIGDRSAVVAHARTHGRFVSFDALQSSEGVVSR
ncbi:hypothetical protein [Acidithrix ferrooxidans]|uniref:Uncharacterized protein n=1 Tax=Acidithrix ferrooxidans TaxID=1280514 RepID=A0A0D8HD25_9ACTN|nr:hypothetical protein [Acidithrix ferrooxidans]KJF15804.1 hypothetical protein AXFE_33460 [Acidithrix ferrooxidans]